MLRNLDINLLRTFVAVADHGSMTAAGNALHLTQSAISQQTKRLEAVLGCELIARERGGLRLTPAGERLFGKAKRLLGLNDEIWAEMTTNIVDGKVRLGVPYDLVGNCLAPILKAYAEVYPQVEISLRCAASPDLIKALAKGEVDLAIIEAPQGQSGGECLIVDRLVWVGAKAGSAYRKQPLPISMVADTCAFRPSVLAALQQQGRQWRTVFENGNIEATTATVRSDLAITAWLAGTVPPDLDILTADHDLPDLPLFAINLHLPKQAATAAALELAHYLRNGLVRYRQVA
jgi:DNA-binding transcriptional LysR family regulator